MNEILTPPVKLLGPPGLRLDWPSHLELPSEDGQPVENANEQNQNAVLTSSIRPLLQARHPDGNYFIGQDVGIYYNSTEPPLEGCRAPDWYYVPGVPPFLNGLIRHSYVLWRELRSPLLLIEQVSRTGAEERDRTPNTGKFWIYENVVQARYYLIFDPWRDTLEGYALRRGHYAPLRPNERGRLAIPPLEIEAGLWRGELGFLNAMWLRFFTAAGDLLLTGEEMADQERLRAEEQQRLARQARVRAEEQRQRAEQEQTRAEQERLRADLEYTRAEAQQFRAEAQERLAQQERLLAQQERARAAAQERLAQQERERAEAQGRLAQEERERAEVVAAENERLRQRLRQLGLDPEALTGDQ